MRALGLLLISCLAAAGAECTRLKRDERIVFYPTLAHRSADGLDWRFTVRGCVFEPEQHGLLTAAFRQALELKDVEMTEAEEQIFNERARLFLADHERGKEIWIKVGSHLLAVGKSRKDGTFSGEVRFASGDVETATRVSFAAALPPHEGRTFAGETLLLEDAGVSVISDIDDTIKITEVRDRNATLRNTFLREFQPVAGMMEFYQRLARERGAQFHYVSASPWQLYEPLAALVKDHGFPPGTFALKEFRWKSRKFLSLFANPEKYKPGVIEPLLKQFPRRQFILIGDSGERDPEIYGALARKFPQQIEHIYIREVVKESDEPQRYQKAFRELPAGRWTVFRDPAGFKANAPP